MLQPSLPRVPGPQCHSDIPFGMVYQHNPQVRASTERVKLQDLDRCECKAFINSQSPIDMDTKAWTCGLCERVNVLGDRYTTIHGQSELLKSDFTLVLDNSNLASKCVQLVFMVDLSLDCLDKAVIGIRSYLEKGE